MTYKRNIEKNISLLCEKYDKEIRTKCKEYKTLLKDCLFLNKEDVNSCKIEEQNFKKCIRIFDIQFKLKHKIMVDDVNK